MATGPKAIYELLKSIDVDKELKKAESEAKKAKTPQELDKINSKIRYLKVLKEMKLRPEEAYMTHVIPVIPPKFRPIYPLPSGDLIYSDLNKLYQQVIMANDLLKELKDLPEEQKAPYRKTLYESYKHLVGLGVPATQSSKNKGIVEMITGDRPKEGFFQSKLLSKRQELTGRAVIGSNPDLSVDEAEIPEDMLWTLYEPFIIRQLTQRGLSPFKAQQEVKQRTPQAREVFEYEIKNRPVLINRAPSLHKHNILAVKPVPTKDKQIKINPMICEGLNADFDGDTMAVHVPISQQARDEAFEMLPSKNLFSVSHNLIIRPRNEAILGLNYLTQTGKKTNKKFKTPQEALKAYQSGQIGLHDVVKIKKPKKSKSKSKSMFKEAAEYIETTPGKIIVNSILPPELQDPKIELDKHKLNDIISRLAERNPKQIAPLLDQLKDLGFELAEYSGINLGIEDLEPIEDVKPILKKMEQKIYEISKKKIPEKEKIEQISRVLEDTNKEVEKKIPDKGKSALFQIVRSGARGKKTNIKNILASPVMARDLTGKVVPIPIEHSYVEGLTFPEYLASAADARKGFIETATKTSIPGYLSKELLPTTAKVVITEEDCGTKDGVKMDISDQRELLGRFVARDPSGVARHNDLITYDLLSRLEKRKVKYIYVRSPLTCKAIRGVCAKCAGEKPGGGLFDIGDNVGLIAGTSLTEPLTQMIISSRHGDIGKTKETAFSQVSSLFRLPKTFKNQATIAEVSGKVSKIEKNPAGGHNVYIDNIKHFVRPGLDVIVKPGQKVEAGDPLSEGIQHPAEIAQFKGLPAAQQYMCDTLYDLYHTTGADVRRANVETVVKAITDNVQITDPGDSSFIPGDYAPLNLVEQLNKNLKNKIKYKPIIKGVRVQPEMEKDFLAALAHQRLTQTLQEAIPGGWKSDVAGINPIPAHIYGVNYTKRKFKS